MTPELQTRYVFTLTVHIGEVTTAGETGHGVRRIIPITGGTVKGEGINEAASTLARLAAAKNKSPA